jgi:hypothetical protein
MLDIHAIIDFCCGAKHPGDLPYKAKQDMLAKEFKRHGFSDIKPSSIQKWIERGQIPGDRLTELHVVAKKQGRRLDLYAFMHDSPKQKARQLFG